MLKTNFFVLEKHALAFRLDPGILTDLGRPSPRTYSPRKNLSGSHSFQPARPGAITSGFQYCQGGWRTSPPFVRPRDERPQNDEQLLKEVRTRSTLNISKISDPYYEGGQADRGGRRSI